jgi:CBS domain-containing protein/RNA polymerase-binding transcription factor DksA
MKRKENTMADRIRDWMTDKPASIREDGSLLEAHDLMVERGIRHLPVVDERNRVIGVLSVDDLRAAVPFDLSRNRPIDPLERSDVSGVRVSDAMTWAPLTARPEILLEEAVARLCDNRIGCLPVVDAHDELVGILSETDALRALRQLLHRGSDAAAPRAGEPEGIVDALWAERERLVEQIGRWEQTERALLDEIREPSDSVDRAADERAVAGIELLSTRAKRRLGAIELALDRAEHGRLGICARCQSRIPLPRLRAIPETTLCVRCAATAVD